MSNIHDMEFLQKKVQELKEQKKGYKPSIQPLFRLCKSSEA